MCHHDGVDDRLFQFAGHDTSNHCLCRLEWHTFEGGSLVSNPKQPLDCRFPIQITKITHLLGYDSVSKLLALAFMASWVLTRWYDCINCCPVHALFYVCDRMVLYTQWVIYPLTVYLPVLVEVTPGMSMTAFLLNLLVAFNSMWLYAGIKWLWCNMYS